MTRVLFALFVSRADPTLPGGRATQGQSIERGRGDSGQLALLWMVFSVVDNLPGTAR